VGLSSGPKRGKVFIRKKSTFLFVTPLDVSAS
jgi:hypothetical protein